MGYFGTGKMPSRKDNLPWDVCCLFNFTAPSPKVMKGIFIFVYTVSEILSCLKVEQKEVNTHI